MVKIFSAAIVCLSISFGALAQLNPPVDLYYFRNSLNGNEVLLFWTDTNDRESNYIVEAKIDGESWYIMASLAGGVPSYKVADFDPNESIEFRVKAEQNGVFSGYTEVVRVVGKSSPLEVYPIVPGIENPKDTTINGLTFGLMQDQCPAESDKGKATRLSTFFKVFVKTEASEDYLFSPVYETRPQIRNFLVQNDPAHSKGHRPYSYHKYGPDETDPNRTLHSRHWTNFDAQDTVELLIELLETANLSETIHPDELEIHPEPISIQIVDERNFKVTLPPATDFSRHYRVAVNRRSWSLEGGRGENTYEAPLFIFVNPIHLAPASAPRNKIKEFNDGQLVVFGPGIHLPQHKYRFFGAGGGNPDCRELYAPGNALLHYGFIFKNEDDIKVWGRALYSDEMFDIYLSVDANTYDWSTPNRTPWAGIDNTDLNPWNINPPWEARVSFNGNPNAIATFEGFTNIGSRMGVVNDGSQARLINHKDVGYGGGTYQRGNIINTKTEYVGCFLVNDDDITYCHHDYLMNHCTSLNLRNGPTFQFGWGLKNEYDVKSRVFNHVALASDRPKGSRTGKNHGVFNTRLRLGQLEYHNGGIWEGTKVYGQENIVFQLKIWNENAGENNTTSIFEDKTYRNFTIYQHSRKNNLIWGEQNDAKNQKSYLRFLHFENLEIEGNLVENIDDGGFFDYNDAALLHTITFFEMPKAVEAPAFTNAPIGQTSLIFHSENDKFIQVDNSLPASFGPLCANADLGSTFEIIDAGDGYVAIKTPSGYFIKADPKRHGYIYTKPDLRRGDPNTKSITNDAKFIWVNLSDGKFALYSKATGLYVRVESNAGPNMPLYAASTEIGEAETFEGNFTVSNRNSKFSEISVFPNPSFQFLVVEDPHRNFDRMELWSITGEQMLVKQLLANKTELQVSNIPAGTYLLILKGFRGNYSEKVLIQK